MLLQALATTRDIVVIVYGITTTLAILAVLVMAFLIYRKVAGTLNSVRSTARNVEAFSRNVLRPISRGAQTARPLWKILRILKSDEEEDDERSEKGARARKDVST